MKNEGQSALEPFVGVITLVTHVFLGIYRELQVHL